MVAIRKLFRRTEGFSKREVDRAKQALEIYVSEFEAEKGLLDDFDMRPDDFHSTELVYMHGRHFDDTGQLKRRIRHIRRMIAILEGFRDRPITCPNPTPWGGDVPEEIIRSVDDDTLTFFYKFTETLKRYAAVLPIRGVYGVATNDAASEVSATINPKEWEGELLGMTNEPITLLLTQEEREAANEVKAYLEAVIGDEEPTGSMNGSAPR